MTSSRSGLARTSCLALAMAWIAGCVAPDSPSRERWPLSEIDASAASSAEANSAEFADAAVDDQPTQIGARAGDNGQHPVAEDPGQNVRTGASGDDVGAEASDPSPEVSVSGEQEQRAPTPYRPPMDMDLSGPMIHTPPPARSDFPNTRFPRPEHVRGLYVNAWAAGSSERMGHIFDLVRRTEVNSLVIDIKDATGYLSHDTNIPLSLEIGAGGERRIRDLPGLLDRLESEGIYPIARIVVVKDPLLSAAYPEVAIQDTAGGVWIDSKDIVWLNPYSEAVWDYHAEVAREVAEMGFPEIQWDYIRFPDAPESDMNRALFEGGEGVPRVDAIRGFLTHVRDELSDLPVRSTADVFGVTTSFRRDIGLGQLWETFIDVVDVALPMVYPSHYWPESFGYDEPNAYPYEVVRAALRDALMRSARVDGAGLTRPWIQDFSLGLPIYGAPEVRAQIQAAYDVGIQEWILWNPSTRYSESALEPTEGFGSEPLIRVAGVLTPVSRRYAVMDSVASRAAEAQQAGEVESVAEVEVALDTLRAAVDTLAAGGAGKN